jgi:hypothetical protein
MTATVDRYVRCWVLVACFPFFAFQNHWTEGMMRYVTLPPDSPNLPKASIYANLRDMGIMKAVTLSGRKGAHSVARTDFWTLHCYVVDF